MSMLIISRRLTIVGVLLLHPPNPLFADATSNHNKLVSVRAGQTSEDSLKSTGLTFGLYAANWPSKVPMSKAGRRFFALENVKIGIEFTLSRFDKSTLSSDEFDLSVKPKIRLYFSKRVYGSAGLGVAYNELREQDTEETNLKLGSKLLFAPEFNIGYEFARERNPIFVEYIFTHRSNAGLSNNNQSLNVHLISVGVRF